MPVAPENLPDDDIVLWAQKLVIDEIKYKPDVLEQWNFAYETLYEKKGDCDDGAIYLANILLSNGIPYWRLRLNAGEVLLSNKKTGHLWLTYLRESDNEWYVIDWCYWVKKSVDYKLKWKNAEDKYLKIWFSWSKQNIFMRDKLGRDWERV